MIRKSRSSLPRLTEAGVPPMRVKSLVSFIVIALCLAVGSGCASKQKTDKELAKKQWQEARAAVLFGLAKDQYKNGNFNECRTTLTDALKLAPENVQIRVLSARLAIEQGQLEVAEKELSKARQVDAKNAEADYLSGVIYQRWQRHQTAYEYYVSASDK